MFKTIKEYKEAHPSIRFAVLVVFILVFGIMGFMWIQNHAITDYVEAHMEVAIIKNKNFDEKQLYVQLENGVIVNLPIQESNFYLDNGDSINVLLDNNNNYIGKYNAFSYQGVIYTNYSREGIKVISSKNSNLVTPENYSGQNIKIVGMSFVLSTSLISSLFSSFWILWHIVYFISFCNNNKRRKLSENMI